MTTGRINQIANLISPSPHKRKFIKCRGDARYAAPKHRAPRSHVLYFSTQTNRCMAPKRNSAERTRRPSVIRQQPAPSHAAMEFPLLTHEPSATRSDRSARPTRPIDRILGVRFHILRAKKGPQMDLCVRLPSGRRANVVRTRWFARFHSDVGSRQPTQTSPKYQRIPKEHAFQILFSLFCSLFAIFRTNTQDHLGRSRPSGVAALLLHQTPGLFGVQGDVNHGSGSRNPIHIWLPLFPSSWCSSFLSSL